VDDLDDSWSLLSELPDLKVQLDRELRGGNGLAKVGGMFLGREEVQLLPWRLDFI